MTGVGNTLVLSGECKAERKVDHGQEKATLNYASKNWDDRKGKSEFLIEGYKERDSASNKRMTRQ